MSLHHDNMKLLHYIEEKPCFSVDQSTKRRNILSRQGQGGGVKACDVGGGRRGRRGKRDGMVTH